MIEFELWLSANDYFRSRMLTWNRAQKISRVFMEQLVNTKSQTELIFVLKLKSFLLNFVFSCLKFSLLAYKTKLMWQYINAFIHRVQFKHKIFLQP